MLPALGLALLFLLAPPLLPAQASNASSISLGPILTPFGQPAVSAPVRVCQITATGVPCSTAGVTLYSDYNLTHPISNPTATSAQGLVNAFIATGAYLVQIQVSPSSTYTYYLFLGTGGGGGSGTVSGQAAGVIPLGTSSSVIGQQSHCDDGNTNAGDVTCTEPIISASSTHGLAFAAGTPVAGATGEVIYTTDAVNGFAEVNEDDNGLARICTALNASGVSGCYPTAVNSLAGTANEITASAATGAVTISLATAAKTRTCEVLWTGTAVAGALQAGDDSDADYSCANATNVTETIIGVGCYTDVSSSTTTINPTLGNNGTPTAILTGALTCGSSHQYSWGTLSGTPQLLSSGCPGVSCVAQGVTPVMGGTLTGTNVHMLVIYQLP